MRVRVASAVSAVWLMVMFGAPVAVAAPGDIDPAFGTAGKVFADVGKQGDHDVAYAVALQADGRAVTAGNCNVDGFTRPCVARVNADGSIDGTFGDGGKRVFPDTTAGGDFRALVIDGMGRVTAAGFCQSAPSPSAMCAARFQANGMPDTSFGTGGAMRIPLGTDSSAAYGITTDVDGNYLLAGTCKTAATHDACIVRLTPAGNLDMTFATNGLAVIAAGNGTDVAWAVGTWGTRIIAAGQCEGAGRQEMCALRLDAQGTPDPSFGAAGTVRIAAGVVFSAAYALAVDGSRLYIGGACNDNNSTVPCVAALQENGSLDLGFNATGTRREPPSGASDRFMGLSLQAGKLVAGGLCGNLACWSRYLADGSTDPAIGSIRIILTGDLNVWGMAATAMSTLLAGGCTDPLGDGQTCLLRITDQGDADASFGPGPAQGLVALGLGTKRGRDWSRALARQADGKLLVAGACQFGTYNMSGCVSRLLADGTFDLTFNATGSVKSTFGNVDSSVLAVLVDGGKILLGGYCGGSICLARLQVDGSFDATFGALGRVTFPLCGGGFMTPTAFALAKDGSRILVGAGCNVPVSTPSAMLLRVNDDGSLDTTFNGTGFLQALDIGGGLYTSASYQERQVGMALQGGKVYVAGFERLFFTGFAFRVNGYLANGAPDAMFGTNGSQGFNFPTKTGSPVASPALIPGVDMLAVGGKLLIAVNCSDGVQVLHCLIRSNLDGSLDTSFNGTGIVQTAASSMNHGGQRVAVHGDKFVVTGYCATPAGNDFCVAVYNPDGSLDLSFAPLGTRTLDMGSSDDRMGGMEVSGGFVTLAGTCVVGGQDDICLTRMALSNPVFTPTAPASPAITSLVAGHGVAHATVAAPVSSGGSPITGYTVTCQPGNVSAGGTGPLVTVSGLALGTTYACSATASNAVGISAPSASVDIAPVALALTRAFSRKLHGAGSTFDLPLNLTGGPTGGISVESRSGAAGHSVYLVFNQPVSGLSGVTVKDANGTAIGSATYGVSGETVRIDITGVPDGVRVEVTALDVNGIASYAIYLGILLGDGDHSRSVLPADLAAARSASGHVVNAVNFRWDTDMSGSITAADLAAIKARDSKIIP